MAFDDLLEREARLIKRVNELAHVFDAGADRGAIGRETLRGQISGDQAGVHGLANQHATLQRQHDAATENGIEKRERIADERETGRRAIARVPRILARDPILARAPADGQTVFDPHVFADLTLENCLRIFDAVAREIFALGHDADADHATVLRDVPEPALVRDEGDGGFALIDALGSLRILIVGPNRDLVEKGIALPPAVCLGGEGFFASAVERDGGVKLVGASRRIGCRHSDDAVALPQKARDFDFLADVGALVAGVVEHHLVEL